MRKEFPQAFTTDSDPLWRNDVKVEVVLPVPPGLHPSQTDVVLRTAEKAGLPALPMTVLVTESSAALGGYLQKCKEEVRQLREGLAPRTVLLLDSGADSQDISICSLRKKDKYAVDSPSNNPQDSGKTSQYFSAGRICRYYGLE